jgi:hypothetical protein
MPRQKTVSLFAFGLLLLVGAPGFPASLTTTGLRSGEALVFEWYDRGAIVLTSTDDPVIRFVEVDGAVLAVRVTPIDRNGAEVGGGRLIMIGANEQREMRLRDEFAAEVLYNARIRIEVLQGDGRVKVSSTEEFGRGLQPQPNAASSRRRAVRPVGPTPTSRTLIDQAEGAGTINSETALLYRVYAIFSDARLPQQYRGDDSEITEGMYLTEVRNRYPTLSPATQAAVMPFLIPPIYRNSWANAKRASPNVSDFVPMICLDVDNTWESITTSNGAVRIWFKLNSSDGARATALAGLIDNTIWPALSGLMKNHLPKSDAEVVNCNGGDGRLDLYLTDIARSFTSPYEGCQNTPAFIEMTRTAKDSTAIHEIMHTFQFSYPLQACLTDYTYDWWTEGTATWAEDFVSPGPPNDEHFAAKYFLNQTEEPLDFTNDFHEYGSYLLPFYVYRTTHNADFVSATWEQCAREPALDAFDHTVDGGFETVWFDFVRFNSNRKTFDDYYQWDSLPDTASLYGGRPTIASLGGLMDEVDPIEVDLPRLSATYKYYLFPDDGVSSVAFWNGVNFNLKLHDVAGAGVQYESAVGDADATKGARVQALIEIDDTWTHEDWTKKPYVTFCRDMKAERIQGLIVIISNSEYKDRTHRVKTGGGGLPVLFTSNMGCWQWKGTATLAVSDLKIKTNVTWTRAAQTQTVPLVAYTAAGTEDWTLAAPGYPCGPGELCGACSGTGTLPIIGFATLKSYNFIPTQGSYHRSYVGAGYETRTVPVVCKREGPVNSPLLPWLTNPLQPMAPGIPGARFLSVNADGTVMDGDYTQPGTGVVWTWHYEAQRQ